MDKLRWQKIRKIFDHVVDKSPSHRKDYLTMVCEQDKALRSEVESLLDANDDVCKQKVSLLPDNSGAYDVKQFAGYEIIRVLGHGGMGVAYHARDRDHNDVALKVFPSTLMKDSQARQRFEQEAMALRRINHQSISKIIDLFYDHSGCPCIVMELCAGEHLGTRLGEPLDFYLALSITKQLTSALAATHKQEIFHRDIKPENIIVTADNRVKLIDFGIAKFADTRLTATGMVIGSPNYMSPEQWRAEQVDQRTDLWSLGIVLYEMLAGKKPFDQPTKLELAQAVFEQRPEDITFHNRANIHEAVRQKAQSIISKLLQKKPDDRYSHCENLLEDLSWVCSHKSTP